MPKKVKKTRKRRKTPIYKRWTRRLYAKYLQSAWWKRVRAKKLKSKGFKCQRCGKKATQVHHRHYKSLGREKNRDLEAICRECHKKEHKIK